MALKPEDVRNMTEDEITLKLKSLREALFKLRFEQNTGRVEKPHIISQTRRDIARCHTILREKKNAARKG